MAINIAQAVEAQRVHPRRRRTRRRTRPKTMRPIRVRRIDEIAYRADLLEIVSAITKAVEDHVIPTLKRLEPEFLKSTPKEDFVADVFPDELEGALETMRAQVVEMESFAEQRASRMVGRVNQAHEIRFFRELQRKVGLDMRGIIQSEELAPTLKIAVQANVELIESISSEYFTKIERLVYQNTLSGNTSAASLEELIFDLGQSTADRARLIARDQTAKLNSNVNEVRNTAIGVEEYIWRATGGKSGDGRTRLKHRQAHGNRYRFDDPPAIGVKGEPVNPGQDIQCFPGSTEIDLAYGSHKLWRRFYAGPLVCLATVDGSFLEATPNHPVLTSRGWLPIHELRKGDYLVKGEFESEGVHDHHEQNLKTRFEDLFNASRMLFGRVSLPGSKSQFHGDGSEYEVDVVAVDSELWVYLDSMINKSLTEFCFTGAEVASASPLIQKLCSAPRSLASRILAAAPDFIVRGKGESRPVLAAELGHTNEISLSSTPGFDPVLGENSTYGTARDAEESGKLQDAVARLESLDDLTFRKVILAIRGIRPMIHGAVEVGPLSAESLSEGAVMAAKSDRNVFDLGPVRYEFARVVEEGRREFASHVYNLSNPHNHYSANGFSCRNCRCTAESIIPEF